MKFTIRMIDLIAVDCHHRPIGITTYYIVWDCEDNRQVSNHYTSLPYALYGLAGLVGW